MNRTGIDKVAVVAHDAGGAELLSSLLRGWSHQPLCVLEGPAERVFSRKLPHLGNMALEAAIAECDWLLCGTSWQSDLERTAIRRARAAGKRSIAFLDHWTNYPERFGHPGPLTLPDALWVGDPWALAIAREAFPAVPVTLVDNPYWAELDAAADDWRNRLVDEPQGVELLYIGQPVAGPAREMHGDPLYWGYNEAQAMHYLLGRLDDLDPRPTRLVIRPHPAEPDDSYDWVAGISPVPVVIDRATDLQQQILRAGLVAGCASMAMVIALRMGKPVASAIPPGGVDCALPFPDIIRLKHTPGRIAMRSAAFPSPGCTDNEG